MAGHRTPALGGPEAASRVSRRRPRVLAVSDDAPNLRAARLEVPLAALKTAGLVEGYFVSGSSLIEVPSSDRFDVIWLQRCRNGELVKRLRDHLDGRFVLDIDDFLLGRATYLPEERWVGRSALAQAVDGCSVLATTSDRLVGLLEESLHLTVRGKVVVCPSLLVAGEEARTPRRPFGLLVVQSDRAALTRSAKGVFSGVCEVARRHDLPVTVVGAVPLELSRAAAHRAVRIMRLGHLGYWEYHSRMAAWPTLLGVCPLETDADRETLRFIRGKSDVKIVDFAGHGHPAVYSEAEPYVDTDLRAGLLVSNDQDSWEDGLERILAGGWRSAAKEQSLVFDRREALKVARDSWLPALESARLSRPRAGDELRRLLGNTGRLLEVIVNLTALADSALGGRLSWRVELAAKALRRLELEGRGE